jgi:hypothetical protein
MKFLQSLARIRYMLAKEFIQTLRNPHTRWLLFGPALIQMVVFGYAATMEIKHVSLAILDLDNTQESRELVSHFSASRYFRVAKYAAHGDQLRYGIDRGDFLMAVQINSGFAQRLRNGQGASVQVIIDSSNSNTALVAMGKSEGSLGRIISATTCSAHRPSWRSFCRRSNSKRDPGLMRVLIASGISFPASSEICYSSWL